MKLSRRELLGAAATLGVAPFARAQLTGPFTLAFAPVPIALSGTIGIGVFATAPCTIEARFATQRNTAVAAGKLTVETGNSAAFTRLDTLNSAEGPLTVELRVFASGSGRPSVSAAIDPSGKLPGEDLRHAAETALFVKTPTSSPGFFGLNLKADSNVEVWIKQASPAGRVVRNWTEPNVQAGAARIDWDLMDNQHRRVAADDYAATLYARPTLPNRSPMIYGSSVRVV